MSDDLISRQAAIDYLIDALYVLDEADYVDKEFIEEELKRVPNIQPKKGEWIMHIDDLFPCESTQECSVCHAEQLINGNDDNFCPNCGARMKGGSDGDAKV